MIRQAARIQIADPVTMILRWHRDMIEDAIDQLIAELDARDGDPDVESDDIDTSVDDVGEAEPFN